MVRQQFLQMVRKMPDAKFYPDWPFIIYSTTSTLPREPVNNST